MSLVQSRELVRSEKPNNYFRRLTFLKKLFWLYFLLLIFEGALRKWVAPQLSAPLLIIRDPVGILIIFEAYRTHKWPHRWSMEATVLAVLLTGLFGLQVVTGVNPLIVGLYGLLSYLLPFPLIVIMGENLDEQDLRRFGVCSLWFLLPEAALAVAQYVSPTNSFVNRGAYEGGAQISYIGEHVRSSGTFSFVIGVAHFSTLAAAFLLYGMIREDFAKRWVLWASAFALILTIPTTGARTLVTQLAAVFVCVGIGTMMGISQFGRVLRLVLSVVIVAYLVSFLPVFSDAMQSMIERISAANVTEGGTAEGALIYRTVGPAFEAFSAAASSNDLIGIGMGKAAPGMRALLGNEIETLWSDNEFEREVREMGVIGGIGLQLYKVFLAIALFRPALDAARRHQPLALLLLPLVLSTLFFGTPEQPTVKGFMIIGAAFCIAAAKAPELARVRLPISMPRLHLNQRGRFRRV